MIRKARRTDIASILNMTTRCSNHMISNGIYQWNAQYPNKTTFENDLKRNELYVLENENKIMGCIVISNLMDAEYTAVSWLTPNSNNLYIHRLAVLPRHQGKGYAQQLMGFAETFALEHHYASIRLDTFSQNTRNQIFYELRGYKRLGSIYFPKQSADPFYCYELIL